MHTIGVLTLVVLLGACAGGSPGRPVVGIIMVGSGDDLGYNEAIQAGASALARELPDVDVILRSDVPEEPVQAVAALEQLIAEGASVLLATSYGHLDAARTVAGDHPEVIVLHQGGLEGEPALPNLGTYFGRHEQPVHLAGVAAGAATRSGVLGYVVAFPIPATFANADALLLGARTLRPDASMLVVYTESWCDPAAQARAVAALIEEGADVLAQHQDCARTVLAAAEAADVPVIGFHADGREVAPRTWLTGTVWDWGPLFTRMVSTALRGDFEGSPFDGDFRGGLGSDDNPFVLAEPSDRVSQATRAQMGELRVALDAGQPVFVGPLRDAAGTLRVKQGEVLDTGAVDALDWFLDGVTVLALPAR